MQRKFTKVAVGLGMGDQYDGLGDRSFTMAAPRLWNSLPTNIKNARTVDSFKALLKTNLFE